MTNRDSNRVCDFITRDRWMRALLRDERLTLAQRAIGCRIALFLRIDTGELPFKWKCLIDALGDCSRATILRAMQALEQTGWLQINRSERYIVNSYALLFAPGFAAKPDKPNESSFAKKPVPGFAAKPILKINEVRETSLRESKSADAPKIEKEAEHNQPKTISDQIENSEIAYQSDDGAIVVTAQDIKRFCTDLPSLIEKDVAGIIRHVDRAKSDSRASLYERREAIPRNLLRIHQAALKAAQVAAVVEEGKTARAKIRAEREAAKSKKSGDGLWNSLMS